MTERDGTNGVNDLAVRRRDALGLTPRQRKILEVIRDSVQQRGYPPSMREIGEAVQLSADFGIVVHEFLLHSAGLGRRFMALRRVSRPRAAWLLTVPSEQPSTSAVCSTDRSS